MAKILLINDGTDKTTNLTTDGFLFMQIFNIDDMTTTAQADDTPPEIKVPSYDPGTVNSLVLIGAPIYQFGDDVESPIDVILAVCDKHKVDGIVCCSSWSN